MSTVLRHFQEDIKRATYAAFAQGARNVMPVAPTGAGKTVIVANMLREYPGATCAIAHRQELVGQIAQALNRYDVPHAIIAPKEIVKQIIALEIADAGYTRYSPRAPCRVAGVDTLIRHPHERWFDQAGLVVIDEGHHVLQENKWGKALALFPHAHGVFPTAHALRADGKGLGRHADGLTDALVVGPCARNLIDQGYLTDYTIVCATSDVDISDVPITDSGELSQPKLRVAIHRSRTIVGDIVNTYLRFAAGKLGVTFAVDVEAATEIALAFRGRDVPAEVITADTPVAVRAALIRRLRAREILQLVNVDLFGEGFDLPAIEVVSMARHTASFQLYSQQFGRGLRLMIPDSLQSIWDTFSVPERLAHIAASSKPKALIIDHVGNWSRHGLPDVRRDYTLDRREKRARGIRDDAIPLRACTNCFQPYEAVLSSCPYCGAVPVPQRRGAPHEVDGDMFELDPAMLRQLRGEIARIDGAPAYPPGIDGGVRTAIYRTHEGRIAAQHSLRDAIALYGGYQKHLGRDDREAMKRFFYAFGVDVLTAQTLNARDATDLENRVRHQLNIDGVVNA